MSLVETPLSAFRAVAAQQPQKLAMVQGEQYSTFADLDRMSRQLQEVLIPKGVEPNTGVVLSAPNSPWIAAAVVAAWELGAYPVFVSPHAPAGHLSRAEALTDSLCVITSTDFKLGHPTPELPSQPVGPEDIASVVFTSGSTGDPKGVMQSAANLLSGAERVGRLIGYSSLERILCPVPFSHDYGWGQLLSCLCLGQTLILPDREGVQSLCDAIARHRPTVIAGTPSVYAGMAYGISNIREVDLGSVRKLTSTGSHLSPELAADILALFHRAVIYANYGLSETYRSACLVPAERVGHEAGVGRAIEGVDLVIVDEHGRPVPPGTEGEIVHLGAGIALGYIKDPERSATTFRTLMFRGVPSRGVMTGDIGHVDHDGFLTLVGRRDRLIKTMDVRVSLDEIEKALLSSHLLERVAIVDIPDRNLGRKIVAFVSPRSGATLAQIKAYARQHLSKYMLPRVFHCVDTIPSTASGKVNYPVLKELANER